MNPEPRTQGSEPGTRRINAAQLRLLNVAIKQLGLDRADLKARLGVASTKDITPAQLEDLMQHLKASGFKYHSSVAGAPDLGRQPKDKQRHLMKVWRLLRKLGRPWKYADGVAWRMFQRVHVVWCTPAQINTVVIALEYEAKKERP